MPTPATPSSPTPAGDDRNLVPVDENYIAPSFEDRLHLFWQRNSTGVAAVLVVILLVIVAKGGWEYFAAQKEQEIGRAYAAATTPIQLKAFAAAHPQHPLAGVAQLRLADESYTGGKYAEASALYEQAAAALKTGPLASRARLGGAMSKLQGSHAAEGEAALKAFAADTKEIKAFRAEAACHLATYAAANGQANEVKTYSELLTQIDPASPWIQRVRALRPSVPTSGPAPATDAPTITLPGSGK